ncbi:MAG: hypothetical protein V1748_05070, partial [Actinomycetota bacterium]
MFRSKRLPWVLCLILSLSLTSLISGCGGDDEGEAERYQQNYSISYLHILSGSWSIQDIYPDGRTTESKRKCVLIADSGSSPRYLCEEYAVRAGDVVSVIEPIAEGSNILKVNYMAWDPCGVPSLQTGRLTFNFEAMAELAVGPVFTAKPLGSPILFLTDSAQDATWKERFDRYGLIERGTMPDLPNLPYYLSLADNKVKVTDGVSTYSPEAVRLNFFKVKENNAGMDITVSSTPELATASMWLPLAIGTELKVLGRKWGWINQTQTCWHKVELKTSAVSRVGYVSQLSFTPKVGADAFDWSNDPPHLEREKHVYFIAPEKPTAVTQAPVCGTNLYCYTDWLPGADGCRTSGSSSQVIYCCPLGQQLVGDGPGTY